MSQSAHVQRKFQIIHLIIFSLALLTYYSSLAADQSMNRTAVIRESYLEWSVENPDYSGNPFDLIAEVYFMHAASGETLKTQMFYAGNATWKWRFTGTKIGSWTFLTKSRDPELDGIRGKVVIKPDRDNRYKGFVTNYAEKWGRTGTGEAFVPQFVMYSNPAELYQNPENIDRDIQTFFGEHGFNGFHTMVFCRWFDIEEERYDDIESGDPNPDFHTFEALETLITRVYEAGGIVHIWTWGDQSRHQTPVKWGKNGEVDRRLQRYIAARLGPLPGWTMGYGFDLWEWVEREELKTWHDYLDRHFMVPHYLGARSQKNEINQLYEGMDYAGYEQHRPDYDKYVKTLEHLPGKPSFSEDRFRIRESERYREKDYTMERTRRGLYHSTMAGGVANIWGHLLNSPDGDASGPYPRPEWIKTYSTFFFDKNRFLKNMARDNAITDGYCLRTPNFSKLVLYKENTASVSVDFHNSPGAIPVVAVDCKQPYKEIKLAVPGSEKVTFNLPYESDWVLAVGKF